VFYGYDLNIIILSINRLEGYFYHDEYIGKEPNERIKRRMAKKKARAQLDNCPVTEQSDLRY
jgi:hypothetical protein